MNGDALAVAAISAEMQEAQDEYLRDFFPYNPRISAANRFPGRVLTDLDFVSDTELANDPFYNTLIPKYDVSHMVGGCAFREGDQAAYFAFHLPRLADPPSAEVMRWGQLFAGHLATAARVRLQIGAIKSQADLFAATLNAAGSGLILVNAARQVRFINRAAESMLGWGLAIRAMRVCACDAASDSRLECAIARVLQHAAGGGAGREGVRILRGDGETLDIVATRLAPEPASRFFAVHSTEELALLTISDPGRRPKGWTGVLQGLFGLTDAEAEIAALLDQGLSTQEIAERRGVKMPTLRTHIRNILDKSECRSIQDLVRRLSRVPGGGGGD